MTPAPDDTGVAHDAFPPTPQAARARLAAVDAAAYARTRNHLQGAVTRLSPYLSRGFLTPAQVLAAVHARTPLRLDHKFVDELGWRAFFHHVWRHRGDAILESLHAGPLPDAAYARTLPEDVAAGRTGVPVVDRAVAELHATGWLHNHARLWLASYLVHLRRVHWRVGADWMFGHLLDGDLASNHLSWQWVAGTGSHKPYLFDAANVARWAPRDWHSPGTVVDASYEALERIARGGPLPVAPARAPVASPDRRSPPALLAEPPAELGFRAPPPAGAPAGDAAHATVTGRDVWLAHPGALAGAPAGFAGTVVAVLPLDDTARRPWSEQRWAFVGERLRTLATSPALCWAARGDALAAALAGARSITGIDDPHLPRALRRLQLAPAPRLFPEPGTPCRSFSQFRDRALRGLRDVDALLAQAEPAAHADAAGRTVSTPDPFDPPHA